MEGDTPSSAPSGTDRKGAISLSRWAMRFPTAVIAVWLAIVAVSAALLGDRLRISGEIDALLPAEHRHLDDEPMLMLRVRPDADAEPTQILLEIAGRLSERLANERVPIAPPAGEAAAWFDAHALFLVPESSLAAIAERFADDAVSDSIEGLRARMSSPLFGLSGEEPRRDPLGLHGQTSTDASRFASTQGPGGSIVTAAGDLLAARGDALLVQLRTERSPALVLADVRDVVGTAPVDASWVGPTHLEDRARAVVQDGGPRLVLTAIGAIAAVLAAALRRARATIAILACLVGSAILAGVFLRDVDAWGLPLVVLWLGFACEGALHLQRISARGWPAAIVLASALAPLALSPYPAWQHWAWAWAVLVALAMLTLRIVLPALHARIGGGVSWEGRGFSWRPLPMLASVLGLVLLTSGMIAFPSLRYRGADRVGLGAHAASEAQNRLAQEFFDPTTVVRAESRGKDRAAALEQAADDARLLAKLVPAEAVRVDSPGLWVARAADLEARRVALGALELPTRLDNIRAVLEAKGFRPDAFGEFLRGAATNDGMPTADTMLEGPLGPWLRRYVVDDPPRVRAFVQLSADPDTDPPRVKDDEGRPIALVGPAIAARIDRATFADWLGIYVLCQMWLGALVVWLGTRSLGIAVSAAFATLSTQCAVLAAMHLLELPVGPAMLPALLLVGASATISAGRACRAVDLGRPLFATGIIVTSLCQVASGVALLATGVSMWRVLGLVVVLGAITASGVGLFVAPGVCRVLRRLRGAEPPPRGADP